MASDLQKKVSEIFDDFSMVLEQEPSIGSITDEMRAVMEEVKRFDAPYNLKLEDPKYYVLFSIVSLADGDPYAAEDWAKKSLKIKKTCHGLIARGNALFKQGDHKGALGVYDGALEYCDNKANVQLYRYRTLKKRGMHKRAIKALEKAFKDQRSHEIMGEYADTLVDIGEIDRAEKYYERIEEITGTDERRKKKAQGLLEKAGSQSLPDEFDKVLTLDKTCKEAWLGKAKRHWNLGENEEAIKCLESSRDHLQDDSIDDLLKDYRGNTPILKECPSCGGDGGCSNCQGSGNCGGCKGSGNCPRCGGTGNCADCRGTRECPDCEGKGKSGLIFRCKKCGGTGVCPDCDEYGVCKECDRLGVCTYCSGSGNCGDCNGSGVCRRCDGKGEIVERRSQ